jgi:hypothetical protein
MKCFHNCQVDDVHNYHGDNHYTCFSIIISIHFQKKKKSFLLTLSFFSIIDVYGHEKHMLSCNETCAFSCPCCLVKSKFDIHIKMNY